MNLLEKVWRNCLRCVTGQTTLQYAQKGYLGRGKPVNRKNESRRLGKFLQRRLARSAKGERDAASRQSE